MPSHLPHAAALGLRHAAETETHQVSCALISARLLRRPHTYDSNGHFIGSYPKDMLINSHTAPGILGGCSNTCTGSVNTPRQDTNHESDGDCDDGGPGSQYDLCEYGTDCADCGPRHGQMHTHSVEITPSTGRRMSAEDTEDALLEAAKAGAHESVDSSALEDSLPAMMTEI